jgi:hypothetical protein
MPASSHATSHRANASDGEISEEEEEKMKNDNLDNFAM